MKHFEEHSLEEILNLSPKGYTHPAVVDGKLVRCEGTKCTDCDLSCRHTGFGRLCTLHFIEWLYSEVQEDTSEGDPVNPPEKRGRRTRWIPVEVRLPKLYETVIVTTSANAVTTAFMNDDQKWRYPEEKPEEKVDRLMLEAMEIANEHGIPYIAATERHSLLTGGTPKELLALSVYQEVQIAKEIKLPMEDLIRNVTRGIEIAYRAFEECGEERK